MATKSSNLSHFLLVATSLETNLFELNHRNPRSESIPKEAIGNHPILITELNSHKAKTAAVWISA